MKAGEIDNELQNLILEGIYKESPDGILVVDEKNSIVSHNHRFVELWKIPSELLQGLKPGTAIGMDDTPILSHCLTRLKDPQAFLAQVKALYDNPHLDDHCELEFLDGRTVERHSTVLSSNDGRSLGRVWFFRDITERKQAEEAIRNLAFYDTLTGLSNRRLLLDRLSVALSVSERRKQYGALLFLDMDNFKMLNDTLGHVYGDMLLVEVANRLKSSVREVDTVARFGGDEFVVLLEEISTVAEDALQKAAQVAEKIRVALTAPYQLKDSVHHSSPSIGACLFYGNNDPVDELIKRADKAMYQAKDSGRNKVQFFQHTDANLGV